MSAIAARMSKAWETIRESEAFQQLKSKYDELDGQTKLYVNLGAAAVVVLFILLTILVSMAKLGGFKSEINEREEMIGYLTHSADLIRQMKTQQQAERGSADVSSPLPQFVETLLPNAGIERGKIELGSERAGWEDKETQEALLDIKLTQVNLRQLTRFMFTLGEQGTARQLVVKELNVDTRGELTGWLDATMTIAGYKAK